MKKSAKSSGTPCSCPSGTTPPVDGTALLRELDSLSSALEAVIDGSTPLTTVQADSTSEVTDRQAVVIARVVPGLSMDMWQQIMAEHPEAASWFALRLDPAEHPQLHGLETTANGSMQRTVCQQTGVLLSGPFEQQLEKHVTESRRRGTDLVLMIFALLDNDSSSLSLLSQTLRAHARGCDVPGRIDGAHLALIMPGASALRARAFAERIMIAFVENRPQEYGKVLIDLPLKAGLACFDVETAPSASTLLEQAKKALDLAKAGSTRTFRKGGEIVDERKTQVQASEKQFLFFGASGNSTGNDQ